MMGNNGNDPRHLIRLRVNLTGTDIEGHQFTQTVFTRNVSVRGARLTEIPPLLRPASVVKVDYRGKTARFRVMWVGDINDEVGLLSLETGKCIWGTRSVGSTCNRAEGARSRHPDEGNSQT